MYKSNLLDKLRSIDLVDCFGKRVLLRVDLNLPMEASEVFDVSRILHVAQTIQYLVKSHAKVILISHLGRPKDKISMHDKRGNLSNTTFSLMSLQNILPTLSKVLGLHIKFCNDVIGDKAFTAIGDMQDGDVLLLENLRFFQEEEQNDEEFGKALAALADIYVNDAFSCSHRKHTSIDTICKFLPSYIGFGFQREIAALRHFTDNCEKPNMLIIGGKKVSTKLQLLHNLLEKFDYVALAGGMANTFLKAEGVGIGNSFYEPEMLKMAASILKKWRHKIILPVDIMLESNGEIAIAQLGNITRNGIIMDIGPKSVLKICEFLECVKTVLWNGPLGLFENSYFDNSTKFVARYVASLTQNSKIVSVAGGGDTAFAINASGLSSSFSYISTSGGAFLEYLEGNAFPGIQSLLQL